MGKSQNTPQLAVGMNGKRGFGGCRPHIGFFLGRTPHQAAGFFSAKCLLAKDNICSPKHDFPTLQQAGYSFQKLDCTLEKPLQL